MITSADDFELIRTWVSAGNGLSDVTFKLSSTLTDSDLTFSEWTPIGNSTKYFYGTFDGNGKTITITVSSSSNYKALFAGVSGATIKNVTVAGTITGKNYCAGLVGYVSGDLTIENCTNTATVTSSGSTGNVAGLVAYAVNGNIAISNCTNTGDVSSTGGGGSVGGIAGYISENVTSFTMTGCSNSGPISTTASSKGALVGKLSCTTVSISDCSYSASSSGLTVGIYDSEDSAYGITQN